MIGLLALIAALVWAVWSGWLDWSGWRDWLPDLRPVPPVTVPAGPLKGPVDKLIVDKSDRMLIAVKDSRPVKVYQVALGFQPEGDKARQGDGKTPEGTFRIDRRNDRSRFHLSLGIDYPRPEDRAAARAAGVDPGGDIFIHGQPNGRVQKGWHIKGDWTDGCIAVSDPEIEELFAAVLIGTEVEIRP